MFQSVLRAARRMPRHRTLVRSTASNAMTVTDTAQDTSRHAVLLGGALAAAAAAAGIAWDQQNKATDCCGIIGVVAQPDFDVR